MEIVPGSTYYTKRAQETEAAQPNENNADPDQAAMPPAHSSPNKIEEGKMGRGDADMKSEP